MRNDLDDLRRLVEVVGNGGKRGLLPSLTPPSLLLVLLILQTQVPFRRPS
jgi:hypothetical protein